ncbi:SDR family oxidoreductase [Fodinisporobacter ferrooxydans]|uniref:SDR family oxidoreductase n=1 Tax=Fodinisporobacter ferrooxydans TaxID=2901836 RepID=A0ABY4CG62_9BACL|nr:SDR family oxidoreductase [Alicyclobacillaceae bacterium MYW30-H2]
MSYGLADDVVIVTGAALGIGKGIAQAFLDEDARVILVDINRENLLDTVNEFKEKYGEDKANELMVDIRDPSGCSKIVEFAIESFGKLDVLVNCAGIYPSTSSFEITEKEWDNVFDLNVKGSFFLAQAAAVKMKNQKNGGRIVNISSTASEVARPGVAHYCSSKAAVKMLTQVLSLEWAQYGIRVNAVGPGLVETATLIATLTTEEAQKEHKEKLSYCPIRRAALVQEIAEAVLFFASDRSNYITGQNLLVDGGYSAGRVFQSKTI